VSFDTPLNTNDQAFDRVLRAGLPVVALFFSGPLDPARDTALKTLAKENAGKLLVAKIRADENAMLAQKYSIRAPTLIAFKNGDEHSRAENPTANDLRAHAEYVMGRGPKPASPTLSRPPRAESAPAAPVHVTDATFAREVMGSDLPVMVDFWAAWCGPCRMIAPALEKLAAEYAGRVRIAKLNVDENQRTASQHQVQSIPTLLLVKQGRIVDRIVGALPEAQLRVQMERLLKN